LRRATARTQLDLREGPDALFHEIADCTRCSTGRPFVRGFEAVAKTMERAATLYRDGRAVGFDSIAKVAAEDMAFIAEVERIVAKMGGRPDPTPVSLRCTSVFRREDGEWRPVHRHADPITAPQAAESVIDREASV
jgi:ketosteroid isomerase-like protein